MPHPVTRLQGLLDDCAAAFVEARFVTRDGIDLRLGRRGRLTDEAASFLRALDAGIWSSPPIATAATCTCRSTSST